MPIYEYKCENCNTIFEIYKGMLENVVVTCVICKSNNVHRKYSLAGFDICEGFAGNSKTGYQKGVTYHPSNFGKFKGTRVK